MKLSPRLLILAATAIIPAATAQDLPTPNTMVILKELDQISTGAQDKVQSRRAAALSMIQPTSSSGTATVDFYLNALENTKYKENHQDMVDWRKKNEELLRSLSYQNAALLQLRYLCIALRRSDSNDAYAQIPECLAYLNLLASQNSLNASPKNNPSAEEGDDNNLTLSSRRNAKTSSSDKPYPEALALVNQSLSSSPVVQWLQINDLLPKDADFATSPGSYQDIMEQNVRGPMRVKSDPRLPGTWDTQMAVEAALVTKTGSQQQADHFNQSRIPDLLFKKAQDTAGMGQPNRALSEIMDLIRRYPGSPSVKSWVDFARGILNPPTPPAATPALESTNAPSQLPAPITSTAPETNAASHTSHAVIKN